MLQTHRTPDEEHLYDLESDSHLVMLFSCPVPAASVSRHTSLDSFKVPILHVICLRMDESTRV